MNNLIKANELEQSTKLTKAIISAELLKMKVDHSIQISEEDLKIKINLLFEDCKHLSAEKFVANANILRKKNLFGKLPFNQEFIDPYSTKQKPNNNEFNAEIWKKY